MVNLYIDDLKRLKSIIKIVIKEVINSDIVLDTHDLIIENELNTLEAVHADKLIVGN